MLANSLVAQRFEPPILLSHGPANSLLDLYQSRAPEVGQPGRGVNV